MRQLLITSTDGEVYTVNRRYNVDVFVSQETVTVTSIKRTRTLIIDPQERARIVATLERWQEEDDEYASA